MANASPCAEIEKTGNKDAHFSVTGRGNGSISGSGSGSRSESGSGSGSGRGSGRRSVNLIDFGIIPLRDNPLRGEFSRAYLLRKNVDLNKPG